MKVVRCFSVFARSEAAVSRCDGGTVFHSIPVNGSSHNSQSLEMMLFIPTARSAPCSPLQPTFLCKRIWMSERGTESPSYFTPIAARRANVFHRSSGLQLKCLRRVKLDGTKGVNDILRFSYWSENAPNWNLLLFGSWKLYLNPFSCSKYREFFFYSFTAQSKTRQNSSSDRVTAKLC